MATTTATVAPNNATAAEFRAWAQFIHDVFANGGWTQGADSGQIDLTTVAAPGAANTKMGYEIWEMADSLQATNPVILKIAYGSGSSTNFPGIWFAIGTATDGAGNLIDPDDGDRPAYLADFYTQSAAPIASRSNSATTHECFGSATTSRAVFLAFEAKPTLQFTGNGCEFVNVTSPDTAAAGSFSDMFSIERARDEAGDLSGDHLIVMWTATASIAVAGHLYLKTSHKWHIAGRSYGTVSAMPPNTEVIYASYASGFLPGDGAAYGIIPFEQNAKPAWPGINLLTCPHSLFDFDDPPACCGGACGGSAFNSSYITGRTAEVTINGTARTYRACAGLRGAGLGGEAASTFIYILMLYE